MGNTFSPLNCGVAYKHIV